MNPFEMFAATVSNNMDTILTVEIRNVHASAWAKVTGGTPIAEATREAELAELAILRQFCADLRKDVDTLYQAREAQTTSGSALEVRPVYEVHHDQRETGRGNSQ